MPQAPKRETTRRYCKTAASLGSLITKAGDRSFRRRGFVHTKIVTDWPHIVGPSLSSVTAPEGLRFPPGRKRGGTLTVRASGGSAMELQYHIPVILERLNVFFGYSALEKISIRQGPLPKRAREQALPTPPQPVDPAVRTHIQKRLENVKDQRLRESLQRLGEAVSRP